MSDIKETNAAIYARVSTGMQGESLEEQTRILTEYCVRNDYDVYKIYSETSSGAKSDRKKFMDLMDDAEAKKFDAVDVLKLDRFSRSLLDLVTNVERLKGSGVDFISVKDNIETATAQGKLMFHLMGAFGEFERALIYERTQVGIERAKREGKIFGRPKKKLNLNRVVDRLRKGIPLTEIATIEHVSYSTLMKRLREAGIKPKDV
jgi:DNA invertase Pin-like site-specific DNA recombinase